MSIDFGINGIQVEPGAHMCGVVDGSAQRDKVLGPFFRTGLLTGEYCQVVVDTSDPSSVLDKIGSPAEIEQWRANGQLDIRTAPEPYECRQNLTLHDMLDVWTLGLERARVSGARIGGDASWWLRQTSIEQFLRYESELNRIMVPGLAVLCLFDINRFDASVVFALVRTHPHVLVGDRIVDNSNCRPPEHFLVPADTGRPA